MSAVVAIGLDDDVVATIGSLAGVKIKAYQAVPKMYAHDGQVFIEDDRIMDAYFSPTLVLWYSYYEDKMRWRWPLAMSNTWSFPDVRRTILWDDKMQSVLLASLADPIHVKDRPSRGFYPEGAPLDISKLPPDTVLKWGNSHCGENKILTSGDCQDTPKGPVLAEPFLGGRSYRILTVGKYVSQLEYLSDDWRKNVNGKIVKCDKVDARLRHRSDDIMKHYGLEIAGIDFVVGPDNEYGDYDSLLLEVNAYPGLDQDLAAKHHFIAMAAEKIMFAFQKRPNY